MTRRALFWPRNQGKARLTLAAALAILAAEGKLAGGAIVEHKLTRAPEPKPVRCYDLQQPKPYGRDFRKQRERPRRKR